MTLAESTRVVLPADSKCLDTHLAQLGSPMVCARNSAILGEDDTCDNVFLVISGAVRTCKLFADGRRHIGAFYMAGDIFGVDRSSLLGLSVETTCNSTIVKIKRRPLLSQALQDANLAKALWRATALELRHAQRHMMLLVRSARERVASFLLEIAERQGHVDPVDLPMPRQDIADYLGLTIETVSRSLTQLEDRNIIDLSGVRRVFLRDIRELRRLDA